MNKVKEIIHFSQNARLQGEVTTLIVYVDDIIVMDNDSTEMQLLKNWLAKEFEIKELGKLKYFLVI